MKDLIPYAIAFFLLAPGVGQLRAVLDEARLAKVMALHEGKLGRTGTRFWLLVGAACRLALTAWVLSVSLPGKPSELIRLALADLARVEAMPDTYQVDMATWHEHHRGTCEVCLAGAVMAFSLDAKASQTLTPAHFPEPDYSRLCAIDDLRTGDVYNALMVLGYLDAVYEGEWDAQRRVCPYSVDRALFRSDMEALASELEEDGL